jgi:hypothetical protein
MVSENPFNRQPILAGQHRSAYTQGEMAALIAPCLGVAPEQIEGLTIIADLGDRFTFAGLPSHEDGLALMIRAMMSGLLNSGSPQDFTP